MSATTRRSIGLVLVLCAACVQDAPEDGTTGEVPPTREEEPERGSPCEVDGERRCALDGDVIHVCEAGQWDDRRCQSECNELEPRECSLGCLIADDGERCFCAPCE